MSSETKQYQKAVGAVYCDQMQRWILACAEKTAKGMHISGFSSVSDGMAIVSAAEKLSQARLYDEQNLPLMISIAADTAQTGFYPVSIPVVEGPRQESLIAAQAEAIVPMPLAQTMYSWRMVQKDSTMQHGFLSVVRRGYFQELAGMVSGRPESMMPDATGLVRAWSAMYESSSLPSLLIQIRRRHCILALCEQEKLVRAAAMDWDDNPEAVGMMVGDMLNLVESLNVAPSVSFYVTGPDLQAQTMCNELKTVGKNVSLWKASTDKLRMLGLSAMGPEVLQCPQAVGLALAAAAEEPGEYDMIRKPVSQSASQVVIDKQLYLRGLLWTAAVLVVFLFVSYWTTQREVQAIQKALAAAYQDTTGEKILTRQQMRERFAKSRPDMLELLTILDTCAGNDILIDSFNFKKGQPVRINAKTNSNSYERVYAFDKKLKEQSGISGVKLISPTLDEKKRQVSFTITFVYMNFSR